MSDAPEQIWADPDHWIEGPPLSDLASQGYTEYIRADHVDALLKAEREKALREAAETVDRAGPRVTGDTILSLISKDKTDGN